MFKNRKITVTMDKKTKEEDQSTEADPKAFEKKADIVVQRLEALGVQLFVGILIYTIFDTRRQVSVARAKNPTD